MGITVETSLGQRIPIEGASANVGRDPACAVHFPDDARVLPQHAVLREVSGRWLIEAKGAVWPQIVDGPPARVHWLNPGDVIRLTPTGPELTFQPDARTATNAAPPAGPAAREPRARANPAVWFGAAVLFLGAIVVAVLTTRPREEDDGRGNAVQPAPQQRAFVGEAANVSNDVAPTANAANGDAKSTPAAETDVRRVLYTVTVGNPDRGPSFQLGTACAISEHHLLTSAAVALALESAKDKLPALAVTSPVLNKQFEIVSWTVHAQYRAAVADADRAQEAAESARDQLESATGAEEKKRLALQMADADQTFSDATGRQAFYDLAVLEVRADLPAGLRPAAGQSAQLAVGARSVLAGLPFDPDDYMVDPDSPAMPQQSEARIFALPAAGDSPDAPKPIILKLPDDVAKEHWSGSPLLNRSGKPVAVYSRPALLAADNPTAHVATPLERLADFAPELINPD